MSTLSHELDFKSEAIRAQITPKKKFAEGLYMIDLEQFQFKINCEWKSRRILNNLEKNDATLTNHTS